ncbi:MAG TPA: photosystem I reaction center protein subunit XI [Cyanobacteria bacterium UBA11149]|nr:photosystem I reaction center protein subunit XI [Cyanobacteria bacterium UBA11367]HBE57875.1 photosystem I reaction center protein subunit XI [Cyanobacteria bacterium UBA11366]HBK63152.1 photosystem I reaction center protein subunit XI [Cyanobacteria bacterium UBA11166]HBR74626.1 photosystem I reaction center protein subunit XI [Cyanobacteria bacterium UBA11159]HBS70249.1 photosystem I reaction center protein subunit XI [Cyanobacteria bacterium UBA11153]HBW91195.1 photosystem I reaction ce
MAMDVVQHAGDPLVGDLATPVNSSPFVKAFINNLPAYRAGLSVYRRGLEVGMAHGYFLYGPFAVLGPLRMTDYGTTAGLLASVGLVTILTIALSLHGAARKGNPSACATVPVAPAEFGTKEGWAEFASGFFVGGCSGAFFAYLLCLTPHVVPLQTVVNGVWSVH